MKSASLITKRLSGIGLLSLLLAGGQTAPGNEVGAPGNQPSRPNIIFILTDDQNADELGSMGNRIVRTPNIDKLAAEGTTFTNASVTSAICTPSRATFLTGQYERRHGVNFNSGTAMSEQAWNKTYPMVLKREGYFNAYIGKNHVPIGSEGYATGLMDQSFDYWYAGHKHLLFYPKDRPDWAIIFPGIDDNVFDNAEADTQVEILEEGVANMLDPNEQFYAAATRTLERLPDNLPFSLSLCFNLPHDAGAGNMQDRPSDPELYRTGYHDQRKEIRSDLPETYVAADDIRDPKLPPDVLYADMRQAGYDYVDEPETLVDRMTRRYQTITGIDGMIGRLRQKLEELDMADNTIIVFTSDHGIMFGEFGLGGKALNYEPCLQVPMIIYDPRAPEWTRGQRREELVQSIDIAPTILDYAGVEIPETMQGASMKPLVEGKVVDWREHAFGENLWVTMFGNPRIESVRGQRWKYIRYFQNDRSLYDVDLPEGIPNSFRYLVTEAQARAYHEWLSASVEGEQPVYEELFDLRADPNETTNLAGELRHLEVLKEYRAICQELVTEARGEGEPATVPLMDERLEVRLAEWSETEWGTIDE